MLSRSCDISRRSQNDKLLFIHVSLRYNITMDDSDIIVGTSHGYSP